MKKFRNTSTYMKETFGEKIYKLALSASVTCPNRDGSIDRTGCLFCSAGGSGDFAGSHILPVDAQVEEAKSILGKKGEGKKYLAYFQSFTGTYGDMERLSEIYERTVELPEIVGISIATRPDCLGKEALLMIEKLQKKAPVWIELGLQTIHEETAKAFHRGYALPVYNQAMQDLGYLGVHRITHLILGLPGENREDILESVSYVGEVTDGIKLQLLHFLKDTVWGEEYLMSRFRALEEDEYCELLADCLLTLPERVVVHRITGDGPKKDLLAPLWSGNKKKVLNHLHKSLQDKGCILY